MSFWNNFRGNSEIGPGLWPYTTLQKLNINWLLEAWKKLFNYDKSVEPGKVWGTNENGAGFLDADFVPAGGENGQFLSNKDGSPEWSTPDRTPTESSTNVVTSGGVKAALDKKFDNPIGFKKEDSYLTVIGNSPQWQEPVKEITGDNLPDRLVTKAAIKNYVDSKNHVPGGGEAGQVLTKGAGDSYTWEDAPDGLPSGGTQGQVLTKTEDGEQWRDIPEQEKTSINGVSGVTTLGIRNIFKGLNVNYSDYPSNVILTPGRVEIKENGLWNALDVKVDKELYVTDFIDNDLVLYIEVKTTNLTQDNVIVLAQSRTKNTMFTQKLSPSNDGKWVAYNIVIKAIETEILKFIGFNIVNNVSPENAGLIIEYRNAAIYRGNIPLDYVTPIEQIKQVPDGGTVSQVLTKTEDGYEWQNIPSSGGEVPAGGTQGQVLTKGAGDSYTWEDAPDGLPSGGTQGQVLTKGAGSEARWEDAPQPEIPDIVVSNLKNKTNSTGVLVAEPGSESVPGNIIYDNPLSKEHGGTGRTDGYSAGIWEYRTYTGDRDLSPTELDGIKGAVMAYKSATVPDPIVGDASSLVICHGNYETQILFEDGASPVRMFVRNSSNNATWSDWEEVILTRSLNLVDLSKTRWAPAQTGGLLSFIAGSDQAPVLTKIDTVPTAGSSNPITSGAVKTALDNLPSGESLYNYSGKNGGCFVFCDQYNVYLYVTFIATQVGLHYLRLKAGGIIKLQDKNMGLGNWVEHTISKIVSGSLSVTAAEPSLVNGVFSISKASLSITGTDTINTFGYFSGEYEIATS